MTATSADEGGRHLGFESGVVAGREVHRLHPKIRDLYVMRSNGRGQRRIVDVGHDSDSPNAPYTELSAPAWQPLPR